MDRYGYGRERSPGRGGYERGMAEMMQMGMQMGMGMEDMWRSMYEVTTPMTHVGGYQRWTLLVLFVGQ
jgi:hypothetical protein